MNIRRYLVCSVLFIFVGTGFAQGPLDRNMDRGYTPPPARPAPAPSTDALRENQNRTGDYRPSEDNPQPEYRGKKTDPLNRNMKERRDVRRVTDRTNRDYRHHRRDDRQNQRGDRRVNRRENHKDFKDDRHNGRSERKTTERRTVKRPGQAERRSDGETRRVERRDDRRQNRTDFREDRNAPQKRVIKKQPATKAVERRDEVPANPEDNSGAGVKNQGDNQVVKPVHDNRDKEKNPQKFR